MLEKISAINKTEGHVLLISLKIIKKIGFINFNMNTLPPRGKILYLSFMKRDTREKYVLN